MDARARVNERNAETSRRQVADFLASDERAHGPAYLASDGHDITTWTGDVLARVTYEREHCAGWGGSAVTSWRAVDSLGRRWYGKGGGRGMATTMRRAV